MSFITLDTRANAYIHDLLNYPASLSQRIVKQYNLEEGATTAFLAAHRPPADVYRFTAAWANMTNEPVQVATAMLTRLLCEEQHTFLVVEDRIHRRSDFSEPPVPPALADLPVAFHGEEVYYILSHQHAAMIARVVNALVGAVAPVAAVGFVVSLPMPSDWCPPLELTAHDLDLFAQHTHQIMVSAYDGESFLVWHAPRAASPPHQR